MTIGLGIREGAAGPPVCFRFHVLRCCVTESKVEIAAPRVVVGVRYGYFTLRERFNVLR
jgi:hypothetical protein